MGRSAKIIGIKKLQERKYVEIDTDSVWREHWGQDVVKTFHMTITGDSAQGKTMYMLYTAKELSKFGRVLINSVEQGFRKTFQHNVAIAQLPANGRIMIGDNLTFDEMMHQLTSKYSRYNYLIIDSRDFMELTFAQYKSIRSLKKKALGIITVNHGDGDLKNGIIKPNSPEGKKIRYDADIKVSVSNFIAHSRGRFGETKPFVIWEQGHLEAMNHAGKLSTVLKDKQLQLFGHPQLH